MKLQEVDGRIGGNHEERHVTVSHALFIYASLCIDIEAFKNLFIGWPHDTSFVREEVSDDGLAAFCRKSSFHSIIENSTQIRIKNCVSIWCDLQKSKRKVYSNTI